MKLNSRKVVQLLGGVLLLGTSLAWSDTGSSATPPPPGAVAPAKNQHNGNENLWVRHTQGMLEDMKSRLNLSEGQQAAWNAWSGDVLSITREQTERIDHWRQEHEKRARSHGMDDHLHMTTPERMSHGLEHMQVEIQRLQDHVALLQKLQTSTQIFYDKLSTDQKTIFDLYWQQAYHIGRMLSQHGMMDSHAGMGHHGMNGAEPSSAK